MVGLSILETKNTFDLSFSVMAPPKGVLVSSVDLCLHRGVSDLSYYPSSIRTRADVRGFTGTGGLMTTRDVHTIEVDGDLWVPENEVCIPTDNYKRWQGISLFSPIVEDHDALLAAHDLVLGGHRIRCMCYSSESNGRGSTAPENTAFLYDRDMAAYGEGRLARHVSIIPICSVPLMYLNEIANAREPEGKWLPCEISAAAAGGFQYNEPGFPDDPRLEVAMFALEAFALDESKPIWQRQNSRLYKYALGSLGSNDFEVLKDWDDNWLYLLIAEGVSILSAYPERSSRDELFYREITAMLSSWVENPLSHSPTADVTLEASQEVHSSGEDSELESSQYHGGKPEYVEGCK